MGHRVGIRVGLQLAGAIVVASFLARNPLASTPAAAGPLMQTVASGLSFPTNFAFAPDGRIFFNEKDTGRIRIIERGRLLSRPFATLPAWVEPSGACSA